MIEFPFIPGILIALVITLSISELKQSDVSNEENSLCTGKPEHLEKPAPKINVIFSFILYVILSEFSIELQVTFGYM